MPILNENSPIRCRAHTSKGKQCRGYAVNGSQYCFTHSPKHAKARAAARRRGGKNHPRAANPLPFPETDITKPRELAGLVARLIQDTWALKPSLSRARTLAYLIQVQNKVNEEKDRAERNADWKKSWQELRSELENV